jgi:hypothetical protein
MEQLISEACRVEKVDESTSIRLYYAPLNDEGTPIALECRFHLHDVNQFEHVLRKGGGVVWICVGGSPSSSPQKKKPRQKKEHQSPFLVNTFGDVGFKCLPELYEDNALIVMNEELKVRAEDPHLLYMMAIPGSGKSRTVRSACKLANLPQLRLKFIDRNLDKVHESITSAGSDIRTYEQWKTRLKPVILEPLQRMLSQWGGPCVLHIDDAQTLMGSKVVTRAEWDEMVANDNLRDPRDLIMPIACSALHGLLNDNQHLRCVLSGTNFFAPLVASFGSEAKTTPIDIEGTFPPEWVMTTLVNKYFLIPTDLEESMKEHVTFLSANRRAVQHFLQKLKVIVKVKREGDRLSAAELQLARESAFEPHN